MITLTFVKKHRSIQDLPTIQLPDLTVVTGVNGSGKSHLLEAIKDGAVSVDGIKPTEAEIRLFDWTNMAPKKASAADSIKLSRERAAFLKNAITELTNARKNFITQVSNLKLPYLDLSDIDSVIKLNKDAFLNLLNIHGITINRWTQFEQYKQTLQRACFQAVGNNSFIQSALDEKANINKCSVISLSSEDIADAIPLQWSPSDIFQQNLSQIFATYQRAWDENQYNEYANNQHGENNRCLTKAAFEARFGEPPWDFVNRLLNEAHLDYCINQPERRTELPFEAKLKNRTTNAEIAFQDLSSGEKIIMSFALCLYNATDKTRYVRHPKLLLFDEVDAPLHPSMTRDLIRVIDRVLVQEKGIKVILTTHSPSTVAFTSEDALFRMDQYPRALMPCTREQAIQTLTNGYVSVTESTRFVLTEAKQDRLVYTAIYRKLLQHGKLTAIPNLVFIQASDKKDRTGGGRDQVKNWGTKLPSFGLTQILGLIDRDFGNTPTATVRVLSRYSLENYLLDPILIYAVLMQHGEHTKVIDVGIKDGNYYELRNVDQPTLQQISDAVCLLVEQYQPQVTTMTGRFDVEYISGKRISIPIWIRDFKGHDLEDAFRETFRIVIRKTFMITGNDCKNLKDMLSERISEFTPTDLVLTLQELLIPQTSATPP